jgi:hypothetical protein
MIELAEQVGMIEKESRLPGVSAVELPTGVIVRPAVIESVSQIDSETFGWKLADVRRARKLRKPSAQPRLD